MKSTTPKSRLLRELRRLFRSMDFVSRRPALEKDDATADRFAEIYQQLGLAWEFLAQQCRHWTGFRKTRDGRAKCGICGTFKDTVQSSMLLPGRGPKRIGRRLMPDSDETFANKKSAMLLDDAVDFHGAKLRVIVQNAYRTKLLGRMDITIAADRMIRLEEGGVECRLDTHMVRLRVAPRKKRRGSAARRVSVGTLARAAEAFPRAARIGRGREVRRHLHFQTQPGEVAREKGAAHSGNQPSPRSPAMIARTASRIWKSSAR
jgi:hypothetical protein